MDKDATSDTQVAGDPRDADSPPHNPWDDDEHRAMFCRSCGIPRVFRRRKTRHSVHFMLAMGTIGLWLPIWGIAIIFQALKPWTCAVCGAHRWQN